MQDGSTPLKYAAQNGHAAAVLLLLDSHAAIDATNKVDGVLTLQGPQFEVQKSSSTGYLLYGLGGNCD